MMDFIERHTIILGICLITAYSTYLCKHFWKDGDLSRNIQSLDYEMPRPKAYYGEFDLAGRKVKRTLVGSGQDMYDEEIEAHHHPLDDDGDNFKSKKDVKKAKADKKKLAAKNKKSMKVAVVGGPARKSLSAMDMNANANYYQNNGSYQNANALPTDEKKDDGTLSASQWRSLIFAQPTPQNTTNFIAAYRKGDIDATSFYGITDDLLKDQAVDREKAALYILKNDSSVKGFQILVTEYQQQNDPLKAQIYDVIKTYSTQGKMSTLSTLLYNSDPAIIHMATEMLSLAVTNQQAAQSSSTGGASTSAVSAQTFNMFIPALRHLATADDQSLASAAQQLLQSIQQMGQA